MSEEMKIGGGVVYECSRATALRTLFLFRRGTASSSRSVRSSSSSFPGNIKNHVTFLAVTGLTIDDLLAKIDFKKRFVYRLFELQII